MTLFDDIPAFRIYEIKVYAILCDQRFSFDFPIGDFSTFLFKEIRAIQLTSPLIAAFTQSGILLTINLIFLLET